MNSFHENSSVQGLIHCVWLLSVSEDGLQANEKLTIHSVHSRNTCCSPTATCSRHPVQDAIGKAVINIGKDLAFF